MVAALVIALAVTATAKEDLANAYPTAERPVTDLRPDLVIGGGYYSGWFGQVNGIYCDASSGEIYVAHASANAIEIFDENGASLFAFSDAEHLNQPFRVAVDGQGRIYVVDEERNRIKVFSYRGEFLKLLELPDVVDPEKASFTAITFDRNGDLAVGESTSGEVLLYGPDLRLKLKFGGFGEHDGQFQGIAGIALDEQRIYVASMEGTAVQVFSRNGRLLRSWGRHAAGKHNVSLPAGIGVDPKGRVVLLDTLRQEIKYFDAEGRLIDMFGGAGRHPGAVSFPTALMVDARGRICVSDSANQRVQVLSAEEAPERSPDIAAQQPQ